MLDTWRYDIAQGADSVCDKCFFPRWMNIQIYLWPQNPIVMCMNNYICLEIFKYILVYFNICNVQIKKIKQMNVWIYLWPSVPLNIFLNDFIHSSRNIKIFKYIRILVTQVDLPKLQMDLSEVEYGFICQKINFKLSEAGCIFDISWMYVGLSPAWAC